MSSRSESQSPLPEQKNPFATPSASPQNTPAPSGAATPLFESATPQLPFPFPAVVRPSSLHSSKSSSSGRSVKIAIEPREADFHIAEISSEEKQPPLSESQPSLTPSQKWTRQPGFWRSFIAISVPLLLSALEGSVTNTALPTISDSLNLGTKFSWVATAFLLSSTIFQPLYGQLADIWGRKYPMMIAVFVFGIGSAVCGWAKNSAALISGRIVQGLGTGGIDLFAELILCDLVPLRKRGTYMAIKHVVFAVGSTAGPLIGGVFAEKSWRWCFWINLPVCGFSIVLMFFWLNVGGGIKTKDAKLADTLKRMDGFGTFLLTSSVVLILVSLSQGGAPCPWTSAAILAPLITGSLGLFTFSLYEASKRCKAPIMPPTVFSNRTSATAFALTTIHGFLTYGVQFYLPPFFQAVKGSSPTLSGIQVLPTTLVIVVLAAVGGPLLTHFGKYRPIHHGGFVAMTIGFGLCTLLTKSTPVYQWVISQLLVATGSGIVVSTMLPAVLVELPDSANGAAAGSWAFLRGTGSLFGVAIPGAMFNIRFSSLLSTIASSEARMQLEHGQAYQRASSALLSKFSSEVKGQIVDVFTQSLKCVWVLFVTLAGVGFLLTFLERQVKLRKELDTQYGLRTTKTGTQMLGKAFGESVVGEKVDMAIFRGVENV